MKKLLFIGALLAISSAVFAETCKYQDAEGRIIYTNIPLKDAKKLTCFGFDAGSKPGSNARSSSTARSAQPTPSNFPRVDAVTQKQRDDLRRSVLLEELAAEQKALEQAKKEYAEEEANPEVYRRADGKIMRNMAKYEEKMKRLQDNIELHEKNIQMLQKELASIK
ncbi:MAG: DUF4124 domain-containing protein [Methylophilaceae bacterium]|nr:DUF4124 domain-containing protein [Methylophilaceae bacterium]